MFRGFYNYSSILLVRGSECEWLRVWSFDDYFNGSSYMFNLGRFDLLNNFKCSKSANFLSENNSL